MQVSGIGGGLSANITTAAPSVGNDASAGAVNADMPTSPTGASAVSTRLNVLVESMQGFSSGEILMAMMLAAASQGDDDKQSSGSALMGILAGMAMAGQMGQSLSINLSTNGELGQYDLSIASGAGGTISFQA